MNRNTFDRGTLKQFVEARWREAKALYPAYREGDPGLRRMLERQAERDWWRALEDAAWSGDEIPLVVWRSALRDQESTARHHFGRWATAYRGRIPDAVLRAIAPSATKAAAKREVAKA